MAQFDVSVSGYWRCGSAETGLSVEGFAETVTVSADTEADISDADIGAALMDIAPPGCTINSFTVEGVFAPEPGGLITVYATAKFNCGQRGIIYRTFRVDVPTTSTRDEVLDEMLLTVLARMDVDPAGYDCRYLGFEITAPLLYQYSSGV